MGLTLRCGSPTGRRRRVEIPERAGSNPACSTVVRERKNNVPYPSRILDTDELTAIFDDHRECIYLGQWTELILGNLRLTRREDGTVEVEEVKDEW